MDPELKDPARYVPTGVATRRLLVCSDKLRAMGRRGEIPHIRTDGNRLLWGVDLYLAQKAQGQRAAS